MCALRSWKAAFMIAAQISGTSRVLEYEMMCGKAPFYDIRRQKTI